MTKFLKVKGKRKFIMRRFNLQNHIFSLSLFLSLVIHAGIILIIPSVRTVSVPSEEYTEIQLIESDEVREPPSSAFQENLLTEVQSRVNPIVGEIPAKLDVMEPAQPDLLSNPDLLAKAEETRRSEIDLATPEDSLKEQQTLLSSKSLLNPTSLDIANPEGLPEKTTEDPISRLEEPVNKEIPQSKDPISSLPEQELTTSLKQPDPVAQDPAPTFQIPEELLTLPENIPLLEEDPSKTQMAELPEPNLEPVQPEQISEPPDEISPDQNLDKETPEIGKDSISVIPEQKLKPSSPQQDFVPEDPAPTFQMPEVPITLPENTPLRQEGSSKTQIADLTKPNFEPVQPRQVEEQPEDKILFGPDTKEAPGFKEKVIVKLENSRREALKAQKSGELKEFMPLSHLPSERLPQIVKKEPSLLPEASKQARIEQKPVELETKVDIQVHPDNLDLKPVEGAKETPISRDKVLTLTEQVAPKAPFPTREATQPDAFSPVLQRSDEILDFTKDREVPILSQEDSKKQRLAENFEALSPIKPELNPVDKLSSPDPDLNQALANSKEIPKIQDSITAIPSTILSRKDLLTPQKIPDIPATPDKLSPEEVRISNPEPRTMRIESGSLQPGTEPFRRTSSLDLGDLSSNVVNKSSFGILVPREEAIRTGNVPEKKETISPSQLSENLAYEKELAVLPPKKPSIPYQIQGPAGTREIVYQPHPSKVDVKVEGEVVLKFWILPDGTVGTVVPQRISDAYLIQSAISYIQKWQFAPLPGNTLQEQQWGIITIKYELK